MSWTMRDIPRMPGNVAVVTGANGGLGLATAKALAAADYHVVMAARNLSKAAAAKVDIESQVTKAQLSVVALDLASLASVHRAADEIIRTQGRVDLLVNNAGVMAIPEEQTDDGFEMQFGTNHLGHFALTRQLLPALLRAASARVVSVTSFAHHFGLPVNPDNPYLHGEYSSWRAYNQSKLANFHFGIGLSRLFDLARVPTASLIAHPGVSRTELQVTSTQRFGADFNHRLWQGYASRFGMEPNVGALPQLRAATDPTARNGQLYGPRYLSFGPPVRRPIMRRLDLNTGIRRLWEVSERETNLTFRASDIATVLG